MTIIRKYKEEDGIVVFDQSLDERSTYEGLHLEKLKEAESRHFWFSARREKICRVFDQYVDRDSRVLEIGGGTGFVAAELMKKGYSMEMADIHQNGLRFAKEKGVQKLYQFDLFYPPFQNEFDVICMFDVLEHLEDEKGALKCIQSMLKPNGTILVTVPAHQWLWNRDDAIAGHKRRYTKKSLEGTFLSSGLQLIHIEYFFSSLLPFLLLRKWLNKDSKEPLKKEESPKLSLPSWINRTLYALTRTEFYLEKYLPNKVGGSLLAIGQAKT